MEFNWIGTCPPRRRQAQFGGINIPEFGSHRWPVYATSVPGGNRQWTNLYFAGSIEQLDASHYLRPNPRAATAITVVPAAA